MMIRQNLLKPEKYLLKSPYKMTPEFIIVHNTANDASAENEIAYMIRNGSVVSFHYAIDDKEVVQGVEENRCTWNAGDGEKGYGNRKGISIEICYSKSGGERFDKAEQRAAAFIAAKLYEKGWGLDRVKKHQDFNGKYCPHRTLDLGWERFIRMVGAELDKLKQASVANKSVLYRVQVGAFKNKANATNYAKKLKCDGYDCFVKRCGDFYRVQVGAFKSKTNAEKFLAGVRKDGYVDSFVVEG